MDANSSSIKISVSEGLIEVSGSEEFVKSNLDYIKETVKSFSEVKVVKKTPSPINGNKEKDPQAASSLTLDEYDSVFAVNDGKVEIISTIPGDGDKSKTVNVALMLGWANKQLAKEETSFEDVKAMCTTHACLNPTNFSGYLKSGSPSSYTLVGKNFKLTTPGTKAALVIINKIQNESAEG